ncbi:MAG: hypothetical protein Q8K28_02515 [Hoeflea sp.]|uniref:hypothetical protein n=1 Tax=Hoeflea sp. TaxID=1940281 RepID=UPI0027315980|nr:hypothetical protein [Hoeflea sp.]MDP2118757.1 hypothetical protein [Hoeflea sp.]
MKKIMIWMALGLGLAAAFGFAGLAYLSATMITLTVFCATPALLVVLIKAISSRLRRRRTAFESGVLP